MATAQTRRIRLTGQTDGRLEGLRTQLVGTVTTSYSTIGPGATSKRVLAAYGVFAELGDGGRDHELGADDGVGHNSAGEVRRNRTYFFVDQEIRG